MLDGKQRRLAKTNLIPHSGLGDSSTRLNSGIQPLTHMGKSLYSLFFLPKLCTVSTLSQELLIFGLFSS